MQLDTVKPYPSPNMREWTAAQAYIMERDGIVDEMREQAEFLGENFKEPNMKESGVKEAYDHISETLNASEKFKNDVTCNDLLEDLLHEKSFDLNRFTTKTKKDAGRDSFTPEAIASKNEQSLTNLDENELRANIDQLM